MCLCLLQTSMGCQDQSSTYYLKNIEPFLSDPTDYGKHQVGTHLNIKNKIAFFFMKICSSLYMY